MTLKTLKTMFTAVGLLALVAGPALAKPVTIDLPISKFARSAQESVVAHCSRGEQVAFEKATHDASLLAPATKAYINKRLRGAEPVALVVRIHGFTWSAGEALARTKALVQIDAQLLSNKASAGEVVELPFTDEGRVGGHSVVFRYALEGVKDADEVAVASELVAAGLCFNSRDKDRAAAIVRVTVSLELQE